MQYTQKQLEQYFKEAYSYENRAGWDKEHLSTEFIGTVPKGERLYDLYKDTENNYWYKVRIIDGNNIVTEEQHIFGQKERRKSRNAKSGHRYGSTNADTGSRHNVFKSVI